MPKPTLKTLLASFVAKAKRDHADERARAKATKRRAPTMTPSRVFAGPISPTETVCGDGHAFAVVEPGVVPDGHAFEDMPKLFCASILPKCLADVEPGILPRVAVDIRALRAAVPNANHAKMSAPAPFVVPSATADVAHLATLDGDRLALGMVAFPALARSKDSEGATQAYGFSASLLLGVDAAIGGATHAIALPDGNATWGIPVVYLVGPSGWGVVAAARAEEPTGDVAQPEPKPELTRLEAAVAKLPKALGVTPTYHTTPNERTVVSARYLVAIVDDATPPDADPTPDDIRADAETYATLPLCDGGLRAARLPNGLGKIPAKAGILTYGLEDNTGPLVATTDAFPAEPYPAADKLAGTLASLPRPTGPLASTVQALDIRLLRTLAAIVGADTGPATVGWAIDSYDTPILVVEGPHGRGVLMPRIRRD